VSACLSKRHLQPLSESLSLPSLRRAARRALGLRNPNWCKIGYPLSYHHIHLVLPIPVAASLMTPMVSLSGAFCARGPLRAAKREVLIFL